MYPTFVFRRWIADNDRPGAVGVCDDVEDGEAEPLGPVGDGFALACGEQAASIRTVTRRYRVRTEEYNEDRAH